MASASEIEADLIRQGVDASVARQEAGYLADTYGAVPAGAVESYLERSTNLVDNWDRPTASAGGVGGDADVDGDGAFDPGQTLNSDWGLSFDVGGMNAADAVAAFEQTLSFVRDAHDRENAFVDAQNLLGSFDRGSSSEAGIAAFRASADAQILQAAEGRFTDILRGVDSRIPTSGSGGVSGPRQTTSGGTLLPAGPLRRVTGPPLLASAGDSPAGGGAGGAAGAETSSSIVPLGRVTGPTGPGMTRVTTAAAGGAPGGGSDGESPLVPIGLALAALKLFGMF